VTHPPTSPRKTSSFCASLLTIPSLRLSRRRKTKCDGVRPRCRHCTSRGIYCAWPSPVIEPLLQPEEDGPDKVFNTLPLTPDGVSSSSVRLPDRKVMKACLDIFFERHLSNTFCCFLYRPDLESHPAESPFLSTAVIGLCARYLSCEQAREFFGLDTGADASRLYSPVARSLARETLDEPSGRSSFGAQAFLQTAC
jgi:hypothetical protein